MGEESNGHRRLNGENRNEIDISLYFLDYSSRNVMATPMVDKTVHPVLYIVSPNSVNSSQLTNLLENKQQKINELPRIHP